MELLGRIAVVVGVISAFTFVILFGRLPALRYTSSSIHGRSLLSLYKEDANRLA